MCAGVALRLLDCLDLLIHQALLSTVHVQALCETAGSVELSKTKSLFSGCSC